MINLDKITDVKSFALFPVGEKVSFNGKTYMWIKAGSDIAKGDALLIDTSFAAERVDTTNGNLRIDAGAEFEIPKDSYGWVVLKGDIKLNVSDANATDCTNLPLTPDSTAGKEGVLKLYDISAGWTAGAADDGLKNSEALLSLQTLYAGAKVIGLGASATQDAETLDGTVAYANGDATITGTNTLFKSWLHKGDVIHINGIAKVVDSVTDDTHFETTVNMAATASGKTMTRTMVRVPARLR